MTGYKIATIYICFSSGNLDVAVLLKPTAINTSYCVDAIAVVEKNATICELFLSCIGGLDHRYRLLNFQPQNFPRFFSSSLLGFHFSHLSFSLSLFSNSQSQILALLRTNISTLRSILELDKTTIRFAANITTNSAPRTSFQFVCFFFFFFFFKFYFC